MRIPQEMGSYYKFIYEAMSMQRNIGIVVSMVQQFLQATEFFFITFVIFQIKDPIIAGLEVFMIHALTSFGSTMVAFLTNIGSLERFFIIAGRQSDQILDLPLALQSLGEPLFIGHILVRDLSFRYGGFTSPVKCSVPYLEIRPGYYNLVPFPRSAGSSTLGQLLLRHRFDSHHIYVDRRAISDCSKGFLRLNMTVVDHPDQGYCIIQEVGVDIPLIDSLLYGCKRSAHRLRVLLATFPELAETMANLPRGAETTDWRPYLTKHQEYLVLMIRGFMRRTPMLILIDPTRYCPEEQRASFIQRILMVYKNTPAIKTLVILSSQADLFPPSVEKSYVEERWDRPDEKGGAAVYEHPEQPIAVGPSILASQPATSYRKSSRPELSSFNQSATGVQASPAGQPHSLEQRSAAPSQSPSMSALTLIGRQASLGSSSQGQSPSSASSALNSQQGGAPPIPPRPAASHYAPFSRSRTAGRASSQSPTQPSAQRPSVRRVVSLGSSQGSSPVEQSSSGRMAPIRRNSPQVQSPGSRQPSFDLSATPLSSNPNAAPPTSNHVVWQGQA
jgi:hypothetical protein